MENLQATELRIGNWYQYAGYIGITYSQVKAIKYNQFGLLSDFDGTNFEICKPIQLTEEWLLKFGFLNRMKNGICIGECIGYYVNFYDAKGEFVRTLKIEYVHTLQNLYFALTGEELTL